jgi:inosose dehydratase
MIPLAYGTYGLGAVPLETAIPAIAEAGYDGIELTLAEGYPGVGTRMGAAEGAAVRDLIRRAGLVLTAFLAKATVLGSADRQGMCEDDLRDLVSSARHCGAAAPIVTFTMGGAHAEWPARRDELIDRLAVLGAVAEAEGAVLAVEPHARGLIDSIERAEWLMRTLDSPAVRLNFDVSHYALPGVAFDLGEAIRRLLPYAVHAHIKDSIAEGEGFRFVLPGEGPYDLGAYFAALERAGWTHAVTVEVSAMVFGRPGYEPLAAIGRTYAALDAARRGDAAVTN